MASINIDLRFFSNRKVSRLTDTLGSRSEIFLIRLWCYVGTHWPETGGSDDWTAAEVERAAAWDGVKGELVEVLCKARFLHPRNNGFYIHDWEEHAGHLVMYQTKARKAARARWDKARSDGSSPPEPPVDASGNAPSMPQAMPDLCTSNANTIQGNTKPHTHSGACDSFESSLSTGYETVLSVYRKVSGKRGTDRNTKEGARILAEALGSGELAGEDIEAVIRYGLKDKTLSNQTLRGIANNFTKYLPSSRAGPGKAVEFHVVGWQCARCGRLHQEKWRKDAGYPTVRRKCDVDDGGCGGIMDPVQP